MGTIKDFVYNKKATSPIRIQHKVSNSFVFLCAHLNRGIGLPHECTECDKQMRREAAILSELRLVNRKITYYVPQIWQASWYGYCFRSEVYIAKRNKRAISTGLMNSPLTQKLSETLREQNHTIRKRSP